MNSSRDNPVVGLPLLIVIHGLLLWIVVPISVLAWLVTVAWTRRPLGQFLGWVDVNLVWLLECTVLGPLFPRLTRDLVLARDMHTVKHRINLVTDLA